VLAGMSRPVCEVIEDSPWANVYWFARMLINGDKYGGIGTNSRLLSDLALSLRAITSDKANDDNVKVKIAQSTIQTLISTRYASSRAKADRVALLAADITDRIKTVDDVTVLALTCENVMIPINKALSEIPADDRAYTLATARAYFDTLGEKALATVVRLWDDAGVEGCLRVERTAVTREFGALRRCLAFLPEAAEDMVLTAFVQEFERRLGQKRKSRAGGSLEDITDFLFHYFSISATTQPEHFQADIEVDKWVKCKQGWLIGISCKRTLRERWKQVSSATGEILSKYKIRYLWHLVTYEEDLSDDKLALLGGLRHRFYLRDDNRVLKAALDNVGLRDYVRPMSAFIDDLKGELQK